MADFQNMVGRIPLIPLFLAGTSTLTIPHNSKDSGFPYDCADPDAAAVDGMRGSNIYEVHPWLWQLGRYKLLLLHLGGLTVDQTTERKHAVSNALHQRAAETKLL